MSEEWKVQADDLLTKAADLLEFGPGWCQGKHEDEAGRLCMLGALQTATFGQVMSGHKWRKREPEPWAEAMYWEARGRIAAQIQARIARWNDDPERTRDEVVDALRRAAKGEAS